MKVIFGPHAEEKFQLLAERGFLVSRKQVLDCLNEPDKIGDGYKGRRVAQRRIDEGHVLRVVYLEERDGRRVITFYPGARSRYED